MIMLAPAYDMLATRLLIPEKEDPEELALTINGKKSKLNLHDFNKFGETIGLNTKQRENTFKRFNQALPPALDFILLGFLTSEKQEEFKSLMLTRASSVKLIDLKI